MLDRNYYINKLLGSVRYQNQCWLWNKSCKSDGYGSFWFEKKIWRAHRASYYLFKGEIPKDMCVCHKCDNPSCINPDHLWLATHIDNMKDMVQKRRTLYGEQRPNNKISTSMRPEIVTKYLAGAKQEALAIEYNCSPSTIWNAIHSIIPVALEKGFKGEKHPLVKLKEKDVLRIRGYIKMDKTNKEIALIYNVTHQNINRIRKGLSWTHI